MESYKKLDQEKLKIMANLSESGVANLIDKSIMKYFQAYLDNDETKFNNAWNSLKEMVMMFEDDYLTINDYINYCMCKYALLIVSKSFERNFELYAPFSVEFGSDMNSNSFSSAIKRSLALRVTGDDKVNLANLKSICDADENMNEDVVNGINALCESFDVKEKQYDERIKEVLKRNGRLEDDE